LHPSNIVNNKTSRKFTTATLRDSRRARAAPQQHCELRNEQELHHILGGLDFFDPPSGVLSSDSVKSAECSKSNCAICRLPCLPCLPCLPACQYGCQTASAPPGTNLSSGVAYLLARRLALPPFAEASYHAQVYKSSFTDWQESMH
jgi:hypothetical protein